MISEEIEDISSIIIKNKIYADFVLDLRRDRRYLVYNKTIRYTNILIQRRR
jgi:hypothetical protein